MTRLTQQLSVYLSALLLGCLLTFAFAPFNLYPLAILAPLGLIACLQRRTPRHSFYLGYLFGVGLFTSGVYWIFIAVHQFGDVPSVPAGLITGLVIATLALFPAYACYLTVRFFQPMHPSTFLFAFPALWVLSEWCRSFIFCGFTWLSLGYSQTASPLKGYAPLFSVYGISLVLVISSACLFYAMQNYRAKNWPALYRYAGALIGLWLVGGLLSMIPWTIATGAPLRVSLVQGNIPQSIKWDPDNIQLSFDRYTELTAPLWGKTDLIVWPEAAIPQSLQSAASFIDKLDETARKHHTTLLLGIPVQNPTGDGYYNAIVNVGGAKEVYLKRRLVPFGEYVPFQPLSTRILDIFHVPMSDMIPGDFTQAPLTAGHIKILPAICFESTFPELTFTQDNNVGLLLTVTNDAWFGNSPAQAQHLQMSAMRSIELGRPQLFVSNDGITAIMNAHGQVTLVAPTRQPYVLQASVQAMTGVTPWMTNRIDPILALIAVFMLFAKRKQKRSK